MPPKPPVKFYTFRKDVPKTPGTNPAFLKGKGWYAKGHNAGGTSTAPKPKPPSKADLAAAHEKKVRANAVYICHYLLVNAPKVHYPAGDRRTSNVSKIDTFTKLKKQVENPEGITIDCSQAIEVTAHVAGALCPNDSYAALWATDGFTGTLWVPARIITLAQVKPGDYAIFGAYTGHHTAMFMEPGTVNDPHLCSEGSEGGPYYITLSAETAAQESEGFSGVTCFRLPI